MISSVQFHLIAVLISLNLSRASRRRFSSSSAISKFSLDHNHFEFRHPIKSIPQRLMVPKFSIVDEEAGPVETTTILTPRRASRIALYGSNGTGSPHYIQLNEQQQARLASGQRSESILKLSGLINDHSGEYESFRKSDEEMKGMKRSVRQFYEHQNSILDGFAEVDEILDNAREFAGGDQPPTVPVSTGFRFCYQFELTR